MALRREIGATASEDRLEKLIEQRLSQGADKENIDKRIWDLFGEEWAIMFTDLSGFSRNVAKFGIIHFLQTIYESERILVPIIEDNDGILLKTEGDSMLVIFRNAKKAVQSAIAMHRALKSYNTDKAEEEKVLLCVGIGFGRVLRIGDSDVYGHEVNAASKLGEDTADPYEVLVTESVKKLCADFPEIAFEEAAEVFQGVGKSYKIQYTL